MGATNTSRARASATALLELLDPARFTRGVPFDPADLEAVLVRRLKDDLRIALNEAFPERIAEPLRIHEGFPAAGHAGAGALAAAAALPQATRSPAAGRGGEQAGDQCR